MTDQELKEIRDWLDRPHPMRSREIIINLLGEIDRLRAERQWISVKDRMPEEGIGVFGARPNDDKTYDVSVKTMSADDVLDYGYTHWMPLLAPPK